MKVFISWSGDRSRAVAELLSTWIRCVIQASRPWISSKDVDRGTLWFSEINNQLSEVSVGIVCLTMENKEKPWILFEAGALAKGLSASRVCTFLIDLVPSDIRDPLAQFNHTKPDKEDVWSLVDTLNKCLPEAEALDLRTLREVFETYWPSFEEKFEAELAKHPPAEPSRRRSDNEILTEVLEASRSIQSRLSRLESRPFQQNDARDVQVPYSPPSQPLLVERAMNEALTLLVKGNSFEEVRKMLEARGYEAAVAEQGLVRARIMELALQRQSGGAA